MQQNNYSLATAEMTKPRESRIIHQTIVTASNRGEAWILGQAWIKELTIQKGVAMSGLSCRRQYKESTKGTYHPFTPVK